MIVDITTSPVLLQFGGGVSLNCRAMGGPRLQLQWLRNEGVVDTGMLGQQMLTRSIVAASTDDVGNYTCHATIDSMQVEQSVMVIGEFPIKICTGVCRVLANFVIQMFAHAMKFDF